MKSNLETTAMQTIYRLGSTMFLPHHFNSTFVGPGYGRYNMTEYSQLMMASMGAKPGLYPLFPRRIRTVTEVA